jgi:hypothetical protein
MRRTQQPLIIVCTNSTLEIFQRDRLVIVITVTQTQGRTVFFS